MEFQMNRGKVFIGFCAVIVAITSVIIYISFSKNVKSGNEYREQINYKPEAK